MAQHATPPRFGTRPIDEDDDLFARVAAASPADLQHRITCVVCRLPSSIFVGAPGDVCNSCRLDPYLTRSHVEQTTELARNRLHMLIADFEKALARESQVDQGRWKNVISVRVRAQKGELSTERFQFRWAEALALGDGLSRILRAHEVYEVGCGEVEAVEVWSAQALAELAIVE
jgi:hypothetical protein